MLALGYQPMSSLWTPGGEHSVPRDTSPSSPASPAPRAIEPDDDFGGSGELSPEEEDEIRAMQAELLTVPASSVIANHVVNIFNLGMLHLFSQPPNLTEAALAIDGASAIVERLQGRLGDDEDVLVDAVHQMRLAYVQISGAAPGA
jgi:hypothetical protein